MFITSQFIAWVLFGGEKQQPKIHHSNDEVCHVDIAVWVMERTGETIRKKWEQTKKRNTNGLWKGTKKMLRIAAYKLILH